MGGLLVLVSSQGLVPRYGRIMYKSKAEVMVPGINPVESLEEEFFIVSRNPPEIEANLTDSRAAGVN